MLKKKKKLCNLVSPTGRDLEVVLGKSHLRNLPYGNNRWTEFQLSPESVYQTLPMSWKLNHRFFQDGSKCKQTGETEGILSGKFECGLVVITVSNSMSPNSYGGKLSQKLVNTSFRATAEVLAGQVHPP